VILSFGLTSRLKRVFGVSDASCLGVMRLRWWWGEKEGVREEEREQEREKENGNGNGRTPNTQTY